MKKEAPALTVRRAVSSQAPHPLMHIAHVWDLTAKSWRALGHPERAADFSGQAAMCRRLVEGEYIQHQTWCQLVDCRDGVVDVDTPDERPATCTCGLSDALQLAEPPTEVEK